MTDRVGQQLGNYRLLRLLGEGGFAQVYLGEHLHLGTQAAVKVLRTQLSEDDFEQFRSEARIIAHLEHPYIIRVLDFGIVENTPYLIMSFAPNGTLRQSYPRGTRLPLTTTLTYVTQVAQALQHAHTQRIIHRDVKPENILLGRSREALLSDFGIAMVSQTSRSQVSANIVGTVAYMAPEQIQGKPDPASDQYSLAVVAYEWIVGERPFQGSFTEIAVQHAIAQPPSMRTKRPELSPDVEAVVLKAMHKEPQQRFENMQAFAIALEQAFNRTDQEMVPTFPAAFLTPATPSPARMPGEPTALATPSGQEYTPPPQQLETPPASGSTSGPFSTTTEPQTTGISRRAVFFVIGGLATSAILGGGLTWLFLSRQRGPQVPVSLTPPSSPKALVTQTAPTAVKSTPAATSTSSTAPGTTLNVYRGHTLYVYGVTWASSDGQRIASASDDQTVQDWGTYTNQRYFTYRHNGPANDVKASHDKTLIASAGDDHTMQIHDAQSGALISTYTGHTNAVYTAEWSPNDRLLATSSADGTVHVWEAASGQTITIYRQHTSVVWAAGWSPDGTAVVSGSADNTARVWNATSGATLYIYTGHTATVRSVSWSEQNYGIATASEDLTVQVWNPLTGAILTTYRGHSALLRTVAWAHSNSHIVSGARDATAQLWDGLSGQQLYTYRGHSSTVFDAQWSADDKLIASCSTDTTVQIWQAS